MDIQLKKGLLEYCVLASLTKCDSYGYQMVKDISEYIEISESTLYPILRRLENAGYLVTYSAEYNMRLRKYYKITEAGNEHLKEFLLDFNAVFKVYGYIKEAVASE